MGNVMTNVVRVGYKLNSFTEHVSISHAVLNTRVLDTTSHSYHIRESCSIKNAAPTTYKPIHYKFNKIPIEPKQRLGKALT